MTCQRCSSKRILRCNAHASDCQVYSIGDYCEHRGYAPDIGDICNGDALSPEICLACGQVQGRFPKGPIEELAAEWVANEFGGYIYCDVCPASGDAVYCVMDKDRRISPYLPIFDLNKYCWDHMAEYQKNAVNGTEVPSWLVDGD